MTWPRRLGCLTFVFLVAVVAIAGATAGLVASAPTLTVLTMGLDRRADEPARTDTILIVSMSASHQSDFMLSLPRDLWIDLPGHGFGRINEAVEDGGPTLAVRTATQLTAIPIDRWMIINFGGFRDVVNAMGGVTVDVAAAIDDPTYPADSGNGYQPFHLAAGRQRLDGATALRYVRSRHSDAEGDVGRTRRQQQVLQALMTQVRAPVNWWRLPVAARAAIGAVETDMTPLDWMRLGGLLAGHGGGSFQTGVVDLAHGFVANETTSGGAQVLQPNVPAIRRLAAELQGGLAGEAASVEVLNGTSQTGLAASVGASLRDQGFLVAGTGNAQGTGAKTTVIERNASAGASDRTAGRLSAYLHAPIVQRDQPGSNIALTVVLGQDAVR